MLRWSETSEKRREVIAFAEVDKAGMIREVVLLPRYNNCSNTGVETSELERG
jgi:hypothetical protein